ncbi:MAG: hypothetical protein WEB52_09135 [Dehalococcoidia bacterium]
MSDERLRQPGRIGPWRLLDIVQATMPFRGAMWGGGMTVPEFGPADAPHIPEPGDELPGSNISESERDAAVQRERARRFVRARSHGGG